VFAINLNVGDVVLEHGRNVNLQIVTSVYVRQSADSSRGAMKCTCGRCARLTQPKEAGGRGAGTDLREGALGEDTADKSLAAGADASGSEAAMEQRALT
jgi:hypothetical protein